MKTPINLLHTDLIAVEVPKETKVCDCDFICGYCNELFNLDPNFDYHKIGEVTEDEISFDVEPYVDQNEFDVENYDGLLVGVTKFWDYEDESFYLIDKDESFRSLLQASGLNWVNEYQSDWDELCTWGHGDFSKYGKTSSELYFEAESKRIKGKLIFLKKIK